LITFTSYNILNNVNKKPTSVKKKKKKKIRRILVLDGSNRCCIQRYNSGFDPEEEEEENMSLSARCERDNKYVVSDYEQRRRRYLVS